MEVSNEQTEAPSATMVAEKTSNASPPGGNCEIRHGQCKWFNSTKGFGFITPDDGGADVFVHQSVIKAEGFRSLAEGERLEYSVNLDDKGEKVKAVFVTGPNGANVKGAPPRRNNYNRGGYGGGRGGYNNRSYGQYPPGMRGDGNGGYNGGYGMYQQGFQQYAGYNQVAYGQPGYNGMYQQAGYQPYAAGYNDGSFTQNGFQPQFTGGYGQPAAYPIYTNGQQQNGGTAAVNNGSDSATQQSTEYKT
mmetsp:Transcript_16885/g.19157  ORF Transcript_16885/g.19157 Transcript_16885/m.19157 type:complete len:247 (-) Transcript_16885:316-1056(-)